MAKTLADLNVGDTIAVPVKTAYQAKLGASIVFKVADKNHAGYPTGAVTLITDRIIAMLASDAKEPTNSDGNRKSYGNNYYPVSNLLQWLNSTADDGDWYTNQHAADASPASTSDVSVNPYASWAGFLHMVEPDFVAELMNTTVTVVRYSLDGGGTEQVTSKIYLASTTEVGLANEGGTAEGSKLALFSDNASRVAYCTQECINTSSYGSNPTTSAGWYWWLRTPYSSNAGRVRYVSTTGTLDYDNAYYGSRGVRPLCNLKSTQKITDAVNQAGHYEFIFNQPPAVSGTDTDLGTKTDAFTHAFQVTDPENDKVDVVIEIDGRHVQTMTNVTLGTNLTASVSGVAWLRLLNGQHTMTITATDEGGNTDVRTLTFTKSVNYIEFTITPLPSDEQPTIAKLLATYNIPVLSTMTVWLTNNPHDASPVWEDATPSLLAGINHVFTNTVNTSGQKGLGLKVRIDRGTAAAEEEVWIAEIGGAFDVN